MGRTRTRGLAAIATAAAAAVMLGGAPAGAVVVERGHYTDSYTFDYADCGFDVEVEGTASGVFRIRAGTGKNASAFFLHDNFSYTETHTNLETGEFLTIKGNANFNEVKARRISGNVFEFTAVEAGQPIAIYDSAGRLVARDRGSLRHHAVFDTLGDDEPGGEFVADLGTDVNGPHPVFDAGFCETIAPLIGS